MRRVDTPPRWWRRTASSKCGWGRTSRNPMAAITKRAVGLCEKGQFAEAKPILESLVQQEPGQFRSPPPPRAGLLRTGRQRGRHRPPDLCLALGAEEHPRPHADGQHTGEAPAGYRYRHAVLRGRPRCGPDGPSGRQQHRRAIPQPAAMGRGRQLVHEGPGHQAGLPERLARHGHRERTHRELGCRLRTRHRGPAPQPEAR